MSERTNNGACADFVAAGEERRREDVGLTRREVMVRGIGAGLAVYASRALAAAGRLEAALAATGRTQPRALVSVFLPGGCDLLDTLVPVASYGRYADLRPGIRQRHPATLPGTSFGLHPALARGRAGGVRGLFERGRIGFIPGIDYANPDLSHYHSRAFWETGVLTQGTATGWLGRVLDRDGNPDNPLQGLSMAPTLSPLLRSAQAPVSSLVARDSAQFWTPDLGGRSMDAAMTGWNRIASRSASGPGEHAVLRASRSATRLVNRVSPYAPHGGPDPSPPRVRYPAGDDFATAFENLAALLDAPLGIRAATVELDGGFDTHDGQPGTLDRELTRVSRALSAFQADLEARGIADRVLTFVWSEFGRRPAQNDSAGTDHGAGGLAWVQGTRAQPGVLGHYPDLRKFDSEGNLQVTIDFRRVYASLMEQWLDVDAASVLPDASRLGRVALSR